MSKKELLNIDIRNLSNEARKIFESSDIEALFLLFGKCATIEEINTAAIEVYKDLFD